MMMNRLITRETDLRTLLQEHPAVLIHFSAPDCGVCHSLKPRIAALVAAQFPRLVLAEVDCAASPELAAQQRVFTIPVLLLFLEGRESLRLARNFHLAELRDQLARPYTLLFGEER
ncbi:MAG TPA: thioredoxin family protein [Gammaproteobacteria bacterium]